MAINTKLIILRGPSGSGKTTIAKALFEQAKRKTALIDQDHYRFIFKPAGGGSKPNSDAIHQMIKHNTLAALKRGYDVILEGILSVHSYGKVFEEIFRDHPTENYAFYLDISFNETVRRHATRKKTTEFGHEDMREWYPAAGPLSHSAEIIIPENSTLEQTLKLIRKTTGS